MSDLKLKCVIVIIAITSFSLKVVSQCIFPAIQPTINCEDAPIACLLNTCYTTGLISMQGHSGFCGPMTLVHNPQYFAFIPNSAECQIDITIVGCTSGVGLQAAIIDIEDLGSCSDWSNSDVIACDPNFNGSTSLYAPNLEIGEIYLLLVDGSNSATCTYHITYIEGIYQPVITEDLDSVVFDSSACSGDTTWSAMVLPIVDSAEAYIWEGLPGGSIITRRNTLNSSTPGFEGIPSDAIPGTYQICVSPAVACDTGNALCFEIELVRDTLYATESYTYCPEEFVQGISWGSSTIDSPGVYQSSFSVNGCTVDSIAEFISFEEIADVQIDTVGCSSLEYNDQTFDMSGVYELRYTSQQTGCDSVILLNLNIIDLDLSVASVCRNDSLILTTEIDLLLPEWTTPTFAWVDDGGNILSGNHELFVNDPGTFYLRVLIEEFDAMCVFPEPFDTWSTTVTAEALSECQTTAFEFVRDGATLDVYYEHGHPFVNIPGNARELRVWNSSGQLVGLKHLDHLGVKRIDIRDVADHRGVIFIEVFLDQNRLVGKAIAH